MIGGMVYDNLQFSILRQFIKYGCGLSDDEVAKIESLCFDYAKTTIRPNNEVTYLLLQKAYRLISTGKATHHQIITNFNYWMIMPL